MTHADFFLLEPVFLTIKLCLIKSEIKYLNKNKLLYEYTDNETF